MRFLIKLPLFFKNCLPVAQHIPEGGKYVDYVDNNDTWWAWVLRLKFLI